jgi:predicted nucleic acid-binding Zn ribbon protein
VIRKFSDPPVETCPKCGGPVHKELSSPAFQFKGTGWYVTDYAKKGGGAKGGAKEETAKEKETSKAAGTRDEGGAAAKDSKPADAPKAG